jgi:hypothetical protein
MRTRNGRTRTHGRRDFAGTAGGRVGDSGGGDAKTPSITCSHASLVGCYFFFTRIPMAKSAIMGANRSAGIGHNTELSNFLILPPSRHQPEIYCEGAWKTLPLSFGICHTHSLLGISSRRSVTHRTASRHQTIQNCSLAWAVAFPLVRCCSASRERASMPLV